jgi:putative ABC transport system ATP-binding protein
MFIEMKNIKKGYGGPGNHVQVLHDLSMDVEEGDMCVILGPSGSGKSTLLNIIGGIDSIDSGKLMVDGCEISMLNAKALSLYRKDTLGFVFQFYNLVPNLTLEENIMVGGELSDSPMDLNELMDTLGLAEHRRKFPAQLSGGQQQRCSIARALMKKPKLLLCDEPTGALDYQNSREILKLLEKVNQKYNMTVILVTHNDAVKGMMSQVIRLKDGIIEENYRNERLIPAKNIEW